MKQTRYDAMIIRKLATLAAAAVGLLLGACASTTNTPPPPGFAIIDAKPDPEHRERVAGIALVSINGKKVQGTRSVIKPGLNTIKTRFRWPQGHDQDTDLRFFATAGTIYSIYYDLYPDPKEREQTVAGKAMDGMTGPGSGTDGILALFLAPPAIAMAAAERIGRGATRHGASATHIDLLVVAPHSSQGIVRQVRAYPDGRVDAKTWGAGAQMQAP